MTTPPAPQHDTVTPHRSRWLMVLVLAVGIGIGAAITAVVVTRGDDSAGASSTAQLSQVKASCRDWMGSSQGGEADDQWCTDMFTWMDAQSGGSMMGSMMWQGSAQMGTACREWVDQDRSDSGQNGQQQCNDMVGWMTSHLGDRGGHWMMDNR